MRWVGSVVLLVSLWLGGALVVAAQAVHQDFEEVAKAKVLEVVAAETRDIMGTGASTTVQTLRIELLSGVKVGEVRTFENDLIVLEVGDVFFVNRLETIDGEEYLLFKDIERRPQLLVLGVLLVVLVVVFAGWQGVRALLSLAASVVAILLLLAPALLAGYDPALASFGIAAVILGTTLFVTHGFRPRVVIAFAGTMLAVGVTCLIAWLAVPWLGLTGFSADASVYLNFATGGQLDLAGLLLGSIIIGLLGVLDDVSMTQASVVQELKAANVSFAFHELYHRAVRVGRDHVGSLVNTLALAYVGAALPLVLLFARSEATLYESINQEVIAAELLRIMVGSMGLVLAVPFTTALAAVYFARREVQREVAGHHHHHH